MKFEYEEAEKECVACVYGGHIIFKRDCDGVVILPSDAAASPTKPFAIDGVDAWEGRLREATHKFYPGDKLTITF